MVVINWKTHPRLPSIGGISYKAWYHWLKSLPQDASVTWWRHQMETFSALLALCAGNSPLPVNSPHKGQWRGALMFSLICTRINDWVNNREAGNLRRHRGHYVVNVMKSPTCIMSFCTFLQIRITYWTQWRLKSPLSRLFTQPFIQAHKEYVITS